MPSALVSRSSCKSRQKALSQVVSMPPDRVAWPDRPEVHLLPWARPVLTRTAKPSPHARPQDHIALPNAADARQPRTPPEGRAWHTGQRRPAMSRRWGRCANPGLAAPASAIFRTAAVRGDAFMIAARTRYLHSCLGQVTRNPLHEANPSEPDQMRRCNSAPCAPRDARGRA